MNILHTNSVLHTMSNLDNTRHDKVTSYGSYKPAIIRHAIVDRGVSKYGSIVILSYSAVTDIYYITAMMYVDKEFTIYEQPIKTGLANSKYYELHAKNMFLLHLTT